MILALKDDLPAFREAIRAWLCDVLPSDWKQRQSTATSDEYYSFQRWWMSEKDKVGLATPHWPESLGGAGLSLRHEEIIADEFARAEAPTAGMYVVALNHIPATLLAWGTEAQRSRYLPGIRRGEVWCQGFSEPNAGSDLASLRTRATRDGDHYVINGQKIWSSHSMYADYCILLTRTDFDAPKHKGITYFIMDMRSPGVEVRSIEQVNGRAEFGEVFLTDVRIPVENRLGDENRGWYVAQATLAAERGVLAFEAAERQRYSFERTAKAAIVSEARWMDDAQYRREFVQLFLEMQAGRRLVRDLFQEPRGGTVPTMTPAFIKLSGTLLRQRFADLLVRIGGLEGQAFEMGVEDFIDEPMFDYLTTFGLTISAGTSEIMRNIIAERGLGLPR